MSQNPTYNTPIYKTQNKSLNLSLRYKYRSNNRKNADHGTANHGTARVRLSRGGCPMPKKEKKNRRIAVSSLHRAAIKGNLLQVSSFKCSSFIFPITWESENHA